MMWKRGIAKLDTGKRGAVDARLGVGSRGTTFSAGYEFRF